MIKQVFAILITFLLVSSSINAQPNIILIMADDLGWTDLSSQNTSTGNESKYYETPNIDRLSNQGMSFSYAYTQQNCAPTRAALLTGQYATGPQNGVYNVGSLSRASNPETTPIVPATQIKHLRENSISIFETIKTAGYHTAWFGKLHAVKTPEQATTFHGIDHNFALRKETSAVVDGVEVKNEFFAQKDDTKGWIFSHSGLKQYAQPYDSTYIRDVLEPLRNGNDPRLVEGTPKHLTDALGDAVVDYIKDRAAKGTPFLAYVPFHAVHVSILPRFDLEEKYKAKESDDPRHDRADYAAFVELLDQNVGRIVNALDDPNGDGDTSDGIAENTLVIFYSDNGGFKGPTDNSPLREKKGTYYEGGIRVPLIFRWPGIIAPDTVNDKQEVHSIDFYPTLADIAGASLPDPSTHEMDGKSIAGILKGEIQELEERTELYWHFPGYMDTRNLPQSVIHMRHTDNMHYKLFYRYEDGTYKMYNLSNDIGESINLLEGTPDQATLDLATTMNNKLRNWLIGRNAPTGTWRESGLPVSYPPLNRSIPPAVSFNKPKGDLTLAEGYSELYINVEASDDGSVEKVELYIDDVYVGEDKVSPYEWGNDDQTELLGLSVGDHGFKAIATDNDGNTGQASFKLSVVDSCAYVAEIPGKIEVEAYSSMSGVHADPTGNYLAYIGFGDWMEYQLDESLPGYYEVASRIAAASVPVSFGLLADGDLVATVNAEPTGSFNTFTTVKDTVLLTTLPQTIGIQSLSDSWNFDWIEFIKLDSLQTGSEFRSNSIETFSIMPNPMKNNAIIEFALENETWISLALYHIQGKLVDILYYGQTTAGTHRFNFRGKDANNNLLSNGIYLLRLASNQQTISRRLYVLR